MTGTCSGMQESTDAGREWSVWTWRPKFINPESSHNTLADSVRFPSNRSTWATVPKRKVPRIDNWWIAKHWSSVKTAHGIRRKTCSWTARMHSWGDPLDLKQQQWRWSSGGAAMPVKNHCPSRLPKKATEVTFRLPVCPTTNSDGHLHSWAFMRSPNQPDGNIAAPQLVWPESQRPRHV